MKTLRLLFSVLAFFLTFGIDANADQLEFVGPGSSWTDVSNWRNLSPPSSPRVPYSYDDVVISSDVIVNQECYVQKITVSEGVTFTSASNIQCYEVDIKAGARFDVSGSLKTGGHQIDVGDNAFMSVLGGVSCATLNTGSNSEVVIVGGLHTGPNNVNVKGSLSITGDVYCANLNINENCSVTIDGNINNSGNVVSLSNGSSFACTGDFNCGNVSLPEKDGNFSVGGHFSAINVTIPSKVDGTEIDVIFDGTNINNNSYNTTEIINKLIAAGAYVEVAKHQWNGSFSDDWFDLRNWSFDKSENAKIPDAHTDVTIGSSCVNSPKIDKTDQQAFARNIYIDSDNNKTLTIAPGAALFARYVYVNNDQKEGAVVIQHRYDATASLRIKAGSIFKGDATSQTQSVYDKVRVEKTLQTGVTYYCGSATSQGTFSGFNNLNDLSTGDYDDLYKYSVSDDGFTRVNNFESFADAGSVFLYWDLGSGEVSERSIVQVGTICDSEIKKTFDLRLYNDGSYGWNLISNPYQFSFPLSDGSQFEREGVDFVAFRRFNRTTHKYETVTYSFSTGVKLPRPSSAIELDADLRIAPQQAFYVKAHNEGEFAFVPSNVVSTGSGFLQNTSLKSTKFFSDVLYLSLSSDVVSKAEDQTALVFRENGSFDVNSSDADKKMESGNQLFLIKGDADYAIGLYPQAEDALDVEMNLGFVAASGASTASISALNLDEFDNSVNVYLLDSNAPGEEVNLREIESYQFATESGKRIDNRFSVVLRKNKSIDDEGESGEGTVTYMHSDHSPSAHISASGSEVSVSLKNITSPSTISIFDMAGRLVLRKNTNSTSNNITLANPNGIYLVEVVAGDYVKNSKIILR